MASQSENANQFEEGAPKPCTSQPKQQHFEASQVLETMKNLIIEIQRFKEDNEKLKKAQEKQQEINEILLQSLQKKNNGEKPQTEIGRDPEIPESGKRKDSSSNGTENSKNQVKLVEKRKIDHLEGEFKNIKLTNFDGESNTGEEAEAWMLGINKYFQIYNYSSNMKVRMAIYNLKGRANIWWQDLNISQGIKEKNLEWSKFKKLFKKQYMSESYHEINTKEFYELDLIQMSIEDLIKKFLNLLWFVSYIK